MNIRFIDLHLFYKLKQSLFAQEQIIVLGIRFIGDVNAIIIQFCSSVKDTKENWFKFINLKAAKNDNWLTIGLRNSLYIYLFLYKDSSSD